MRVTLLGHATVLVEMGPMKILMDPVLQDPFEDGLVVSCPRRQIDVDRFPPVDVVIISHRHPDHFDLFSLDRLSRNCQVCCPTDPLITHALKLLGFQHVTVLEPGKPMSLEKMEILPTRSENQSVRECGILFRDQTGTFWNQVDTEISPATINSVLQHCARVDLLFAMYASQNFSFFESQDKSFPYETHRQNLQNALMIRPGLTVPGSAGFRFFGEHEWLNRFLFPISRELFLHDLRTLDATLETAIMNPGDVAEINSGDVKIHQQASPFSKTLQDDTHQVSFNPTSTIPPLKDPNPEGYEIREMEGTISKVIKQGLFKFCLEHARNQLEVAGKYFACRAIYGLEVVFPHYSKHWTIDFRSDPICLYSEKNAQANVIHQIAASALNGWILRRRSFFYVRAYSRRFSTYHRVYGDAAGVHVIPVQLPDLLMYYLIYGAEDSSDSARRRIEYEVMQLKRVGNLLDMKPKNY
ncbi:MAG: MBL fold metallo-hydrolase [Candidatus Binatia bacterium]